MKRAEHLLIILAEECAEVAQRASKALRFGLEEIEPGQSLDKAERLLEELVDLGAVVQMLEEDGYLSAGLRVGGALKKQKVEKFLELSARLGTLR